MMGGRPEDAGCGHPEDAGCGRASGPTSSLDSGPVASSSLVLLFLYLPLPTEDSGFFTALHPSLFQAETLDPPREKGYACHGTNPPLFRPQTQVSDSFSRLHYEQTKG